MNIYAMTLSAIVFSTVAVACASQTDPAEETEHVGAATNEMKSLPCNGTCTQSEVCREGHSRDGMEFKVCCNPAAPSVNPWGACRSAWGY